MRIVDRNGADSAVQGTLLMLAVLVTIASIVAAFAFGIAGTVSEGRIVAATADQVGDAIAVTWHGGQDNEFVSFWYVTLHDSLVQPDTFPGYPPVTGNTTVFHGQGTDGNDHVVVSAVFMDGTAQVVLDTYV